MAILDTLRAKLSPRIHCDRCHQDKKPSEFRQYHGDRDRDEVACDSCIWFNVVVSAEEEQQVRALAERIKRLPLSARNANASDNPWDVFSSSELRSKHIYVLGKTGTGKSTFLKLLCRHDIRRGEGVAFIDPHGDAVKQLLEQIPDERIDDVIYFAPATTSTRFNLLSLRYRPDKLAQDTVSLFEMFFGNSWGPRLAHFLRFGILTLLLDDRPHSLRDAHRLFTDETFRRTITDRATDPDIASFWENEFPHAEKQAVGAITNKLSSFLLPGSPLSRLFSTAENDLDFSAIMKDRKILLVNLAKGELGEEPSRLLGGMIATALQQAALARTTIPERERTPFHLFVDEFHNYTVASFETILTEARKYQLTLTLAHQHLGQLPASLRDAILGNVGTIVAFRCSAEDATQLKRRMHRTITSWPDGDTDVEGTVFREGKERAAQFIEKFLSNLRPFRDREGNPIFRHPFASTGRNLQLDAFRTDMKVDGPGFRELCGFSDAKLVAWVLHLGRLYTSHWETRESEWPAVRDFENLPDRTAFMRIERAENVEQVEFTFLTPDPAQREKVLARQRELFPEVAAPVDAPPTPRKRMLPQTEEDEFF